MTATPETLSTKPPFWRDLRIIKILIQVVAIAVSIAIILYLWGNLTTNLRRAGLSTSFSFLTQPLGVDVPGSNVGPRDPIWRGLLAGIRNTFALVLVGIPLLTGLGVLIGIGKLSTNWLVAKVCALYVEIFRNLPPLLIIFFMYLAVFLELPTVENSWNLFGLIIVNNRFAAVPGFAAGPGATTFMVILAVAVLIGVGIWIWRTRYSERTGEPHRRVLWSFGWLVVAAVAAYLMLDRPITISVPEIVGGRNVVGGISGFANYFAVLFALSLYTASHVAEITRGSILAVPKGQSEAANALALTSFQRLRYVVLPQAMRVGIPPTISQYLNFTKNTSLALAVGYAEITRVVFQTIGNGQPAPQLIAMLMLSYLVFSLTISIIVNILNRRLAYVT